MICPTCDGSGQRSTSRGQSYDCRSCAGKGRIECSLLCSSCEGTGQITAELQRKIRDKYQVRWDNTSPLQTVCRILIGLNVAVFLLERYGPPAVAAPMWTYGYDTATGLPQGEIWRLLTPAFFHGGWWHLLLNCGFIASFCPRMEGVYGSPRFLTLYLLSAMGGNAMSWYGNCYLSGMQAAGVGASTALFGVSAAFLALHLRWSLFSRGEVAYFSRYMAAFVVLTLLAHQYLPIDQWGHLGGFLSGLLFVAATRRPAGR